MTFGVRRASLSISETADLLILQQHSDGSVRICCKQHKNMTPSCLVSTVQAGGGGGVMVLGIFGPCHKAQIISNW